MQPACSALANARPVTVEWQDDWFEVVINRPGEFPGDEKRDRGTDANDYFFISAPAGDESFKCRENGISERY
jgi:hypothetical protein